MKKAVCIMSGGLDSAVAAFIAREEGYEVHGLHFDYHTNENKEDSTIFELALMETIPMTYMKLNMACLGAPTPEDGLKSNKTIGDASPTYSPARNTIFLSLGARMAEAIRAECVFSGIQYESGYPDTSASFVIAMGTAIRIGTAAHIKVQSPLVHMSKTKIVAEGIKRNVPFELTWSCYDSKQTPCGVCDSCLLRAKAFYENQIKDPLYTDSLWKKQVEELKRRELL